VAGGIIVAIRYQGCMDVAAPGCPGRPSPPLDAGTDSATTPDSAVSLDSGPRDTGALPDAPPPDARRDAPAALDGRTSAVPQFRGSGGCACHVTRTPDAPTTLAPLALVVLCLVSALRRGQPLASFRSPRNGSGGRLTTREPNCSMK
jgi:MYXO-CTERM domain-containing protein